MKPSETQLPLNWVRANLSDVCDILPGYGFPESLQGRTEGEVPFYKVGDISEAWKRGAIHLSTANHYISQKEAASLNARLLPPATTVFAKIGAAIALNRRALLSVHSLVDNNVMGLHPNDAILNPAYLFYFTCTLRLNEISQATTVPSIRKTDVERIQLPLAPPSEQARIVLEIEKQFTRLDAAVDALKRVQANLKRYRATVLKTACEGRLVPTEAELARREGRSYERASTLLERVLAKRKQKQKQKRSPAEPDMTDPPPLPEGWSHASVDAMVSEITSGSRDWSPFYGRGSSVFLMAQNVRPGRLDLSFRQLVDPPKDDPSRTRSQVKEQDLLVTIVGANTGDVCRVPVALPEHFVCQSVALMRPVLPETSVFLDLYLNSQEHGVKQFKRYIYGAGRPHLRFDQLMMTCLVVPPLAEQARIVAEVERRLSLVDEIEAQIKQDLLRAKGLRDSVLKRAFAGRLVPQEPNDEPASVLLERIKAEKEIVAKAAVPRGRPKKEALHVS
jgi:type I restriction enzyme S subunit